MTNIVSSSSRRTSAFLVTPTQTESPIRLQASKASKKYSIRHGGAWGGLATESGAGGIQRSQALKELCDVGFLLLAALKGNHIFIIRPRGLGLAMSQDRLFARFSASDCVQSRGILPGYLILVQNTAGPYPCSDQGQCFWALPTLQRHLRRLGYPIKTNPSYTAIHQLGKKTVALHMWHCSRAGVESGDASSHGDEEETEHSLPGCP